MSEVTSTEPAEVDVLIVIEDGGELEGWLSDAGYGVSTAIDPDSVAHALSESSAHVIVIDMDAAAAAQILARFAADRPDGAVILLASEDDPKVSQLALDASAAGYLVRPLSRGSVEVAVAAALRGTSITSERGRMEQMVRDRTQELWTAIARLEAAEKEIRESREETIQRLARAAEFRENETARHIQRMSHYCGLLAELMGSDLDRIDMVRVAAIMHDVGKIGIPDRILMKPGSLNDEEWEVMKGHAEIGYRILGGSDSPFLELAASIALTHHEKVDGSGYPQGLEGDDIPVEGRIAAIADVFDALTTDRVYKSAYPIGKAVEIMQEDSGKHFDPELLDLFLNNLDRALAIREEYPDL